MRFCSLSCAFVLLAAPLIAQQPKPPSSDTLTQITERGRRLQAYDQAAWHATDAVLALSPPEGSVHRYIAKKAENGWAVAFGKLSENGDRFLIAYEALPTGKDDSFKVEKYDPPREDRDFYLFAARAANLALKSFVAENRPYNVAVLPEPGKLLVYVLPAQTRSDVYPLGGDERYTTDAEGTKIVEDRRMHKAILELSNKETPEGGKMVYAFHVAILDDLPEDSDVFHVLTQQPRHPEMIATRHFMYEVAMDGSIKFLGDVQKFLGKK
jgi:hypothetical protein